MTVASDSVGLMAAGSEVDEMLGMDGSGQGGCSALVKKSDFLAVQAAPVVAYLEGG
jgi:hypothetical protein